MQHRKVKINQDQSPALSPSWHSISHLFRHAVWHSKSLSGRSSDVLTWHLFWQPSDIWQGSEGVRVSRDVLLNMFEYRDLHPASWEPDLKPQISSSCVSVIPYLTIWWGHTQWHATSCTAARKASTHRRRHKTKTKTSKHADTCTPTSNNQLTLPLAVTLTVSQLRPGTFLLVHGVQLSPKLWFHAMIWKNSNI